MATSRFTVRDSFEPVSLSDWRALVELELKGASLDRKLVARTYEGIALQPLHAADSTELSDHSGFPGAMPFVRGNAHAMRSRARFSQPRFEPSLDLLRAHVEEDAAHGVNEVELCFDQATRRGLQPDDPAARDLVGVGGVCLYSRHDLHAVLDGVAGKDVSVSLRAGASFLPVAAGLAAWWRALGVAQPCGAFNADPLAVLAAEGQLPTSLGTALDQVAALTGWTSRQLPGVTSIGVGTSVYHRAGASAVTDLGLSLASGVEYLRQLEARGLAPELVARQMRFSYAVGTRPFMAIAKLRAARLVWARVLEACGVTEESRGMCMQVETSRRVLTRRDPWVNMLRNTACCLAAVVAGADVVCSLPFDTELGLPNGVARRVARNTPAILREESQLDRVVDAAGGSWLVESLTTELAEKAWQVFQSVESTGGMARTLESGELARILSADLEPRRRNIATRRDALIGVSEFPIANERLVEPAAVDWAVARQEAEARAKPNGTAAGMLAALAEIRGDARIEALIGVMDRGVTFGQVSRVLARDPANGEAPARLPAAITPYRFADAFEQLRDAVDRHEGKLGRRPRVFLANVGSLAQHTARSTYARGFFEAGGFEVTEGKGSEDVEAIAAQFRECAAAATVICSSDALYEQLVAKLAPALRRAGAATVVLAGNPGQHEGSYRAAGVSRFIHIGCDVVANLTELLEEQGVVS